MTKIDQAELNAEHILQALDEPKRISHGTLAGRLEAQRTAMFDMMAIVGSVTSALDGMKECEGGYLYPLYRALLVAERMSNDITAAMEPAVFLDPEVERPVERVPPADPDKMHAVFQVQAITRLVADKVNEWSNKIPPLSPGGEKDKEALSVVFSLDAASKICDRLAADLDIKPSIA